MNNEYERMEFWQPNNTIKEKVFTTSPNIKRVKYYSNTNTLEIETMNGKLYHYYMVPLEVASNMLKTNDKEIGAYWHNVIKGRYRFINVNGW